MDSLEKIRKMHLADPQGEPEDRGRYYYAKKFAGGMGRAYIGYSEAMYMMGDSASEMYFRLFSMTDDENIPVFYMDAAAVSAKISDEKKALALDLLNMITGKDIMVKTSMNNGNPRYLLPARYSVYDTLAPDYPIYEDLKKLLWFECICIPNQAGWGCISGRGREQRGRASISYPVMKDGP